MGLYRDGKTGATGSVSNSVSFYQRVDDDIYLKVPLTITEAALGCKKTIPTIYGNIKLNIPAGSNSGDKQRIKEKGIKNETNRHKGDMYVVYKVYTL